MHSNIIKLPEIVLIPYNVFASYGAKLIAYYFGANHGKGLK